MYVMLFGMVGTAVSAINGSVSFVLGQTYHTDRAHFLRLYRAFETYNMALTFALYLTADVFILPFFEALHRRCDGYFVSRFRFAASFLSARTCFQTDVQPRSASSNTPGIFKKRRTVPSSNPSSIFSYRFLLVVPFGMYGVLIGTIAALLYRNERYDFLCVPQALHAPAQHTYRKIPCATGVLFVLLWFSAKALPLPLNSYPALLLSAAVFFAYSAFAFLKCSALRWIVTPAAFFSPFGAEQQRSFFKKNNIFAAK